MRINFRKIEDVTAVVSLADVTAVGQFNIPSGDVTELIGRPVVLAVNASYPKLAKVLPYKGTGLLAGVIKSVSQIQEAYENIGTESVITVSIATVGDQFVSIAGGAIAAGATCGFDANGQIVAGATNGNCWAIQPSKAGEPVYVIYGVYSQEAPTSN